MTSKKGGVELFTENNKGFTIITNFGCNNKCSYCISKHHPILQNRTTDIDNINWNYLEECIQKTNSPKVNLSGGGDPFYNYVDNINFYSNIYNISQRNNKLLDIHTRILPNDFELVMLFNKIALSVEYNDTEAINNLNEKYKYIKNLTNIRAIQVVNSKLTVQDCLNYINTMKDIGIKQITFRQMFGNRKAYEHFDYLKENVKDIEGVMFLKDGEYHSYYFTTNNTLYPYFFGYTEADRNKWMKIYEDIEQSCS